MCTERALAKHMDKLCPSIKIQQGPIERVCCWPGASEAGPILEHAIEVVADGVSWLGYQSCLFFLIEGLDCS